MLFFTLTIAAAASLGAHAWHDRCDGFQLSEIEGISAELDFARYYTAGSLVNLDSLQGAVEDSDLPAFCRVKVIIHTSNASQAETEVWLPDAWKDRTVGFGNGGWGGGMVFDSLAYDGILRGYSSFSTNNGHNGTSIDGSFALNNPEGLNDYGYRAMHQSSVAARAITRQYYNKEPYKNYYLGCSTGGRQGLTSAVLYPEDFDGIVVGSPATPFSGLQTWSIWIDNIALPVNGLNWLGDKGWEIIRQGAIDQCDALDGIKDDIISDPLRCNFRPELLACRPGQTEGCLSPGQIETVKKAYKPLYGSATNDPSTLDTMIFHGYYPGGEENYASGLVAETPLGISTSYFANAVYNDTAWDPSTLDFADYQKAVEVNAGNMNLFDPNITAFAGRGGKMLHYVGWGDQLISAGNSIRYADAVTAFTLANTDMDPSSFYKLYTVPGMGHCSGGRGAYGFGGEGQRPLAPPLNSTAEYDIFEAMVHWVENKDQEPDVLVATKYQNDNVEDGVAFTRPLCVYPKLPYYKGGDEDDATSFVCQQ